MDYLRSLSDITANAAQTASIDSHFSNYAIKLLFLLNHDVLCGVLE